VVLDAPPTGRITRFLNVNAEVSGLAKVGPIHNHAELVMSVIASPRTAVHLVTLLEEMPVQETIDAVDELHEVDLPVGGVIVNMVRPPMLTDKQIDEALADELPRAGIQADLDQLGIGGAANTSGLLDEARDHAQRVSLERRERARLESVQQPTIELPYLPDGIDIGALWELAELLRAQGVR
jgi:anion-transporting  ArsA/GET3 family ATPase